MAKDELPTPGPNNGDSTSGTERVSRRALIQGAAGLTLLTASGTVAWAGDACDELLVFNEDDLRRKVAALFGLLRSDSAVRRQFFEDPSRVIIAAILPKGVEMPPEQQISEGNRFLFSLLANDGFRRWASDFQSRLSAGIASGRIDPRTLDRAALYQEVAKAFVEYGDKNLIASLVPLPEMPGVCTVTHVSTCIEIYIAAAALLIAVITIIDFTPIAEPASRLSPMELRSIADQLVAQAKELDRTGRLADVTATIP